LWLIIRKEVGQDAINYQLSNAASDTDIMRLAKMSRGRYWIERAIKDAKGVGSLETMKHGFGEAGTIAMSFRAMLVSLPATFSAFF